MYNKAVTAVFLANAVFWGLADHGSHCRFAARLGVSKCPPHYVHLMIGVLFFLAAVYNAQHKYLSP